MNALVPHFPVLLVVLPLIGHATWHGYKQTIDASLWSENRKLSNLYPSARDSVEQ